jgi:hypothetical protein
LKAGAIDTDAGEDNKLVERTVLEGLAANMGITKTEMKELTDDGLIGLIVSRYDDLYGESGVVLKQNYNTRDELAKQEDDMRLAMVAGTEDIYRDASGEEAAQRVMDGLIKAEAGLGVAVE